MEINEILLIFGDKPFDIGTLVLVLIACILAIGAFGFYLIEFIINTMKKFVLWISNGYSINVRKYLRIVWGAITSFITFILWSVAASIFLFGFVSLIGYIVSLIFNLR